MCHFLSLAAVNGTLAEGLSLTVDERKKLAESWIQASRGRLEVIVHVGAQCIKDAQEMVRVALTSILLLVMKTIVHLVVLVTRLDTSK